MSSTKAIARPTLEAQMAAVAVRNLRLTISQDGSAEIIQVQLNRPLWAKPFLKLLGIPAVRRYRLEGMGLEVWQAVDGQATLGAIVAGFAERHRLSFHEARPMILGYLRTLLGRGLLVIVGVALPADDELHIQV
jgi:hypothetical protein